MRHAQATISFAILIASACGTTKPEPAPTSQLQGGPAVEPARANQPAMVAIPNARNPAPGIVTGGAPSEANLEEAKQLGYRTVVSLLPEAESAAEAAKAMALGLAFVSIPIAGEADLTEDNARKLGDVLSAPSSRPLILHCASGNRAGALLALHAFYVEGRSPSEALTLGEAAGLTKLRDTVQAKLATATEAAP